MNIPTQHLSVRVPWHDAGWNGKICCNPRENASCMFLSRINSSKNVEEEEKMAEQWIHKIQDEDKLPPCVAEKVHFMSPHPIDDKKNHPYADMSANSKYYGHYRETTFRYPVYSFAVVPYNWMLKDPNTNESERAQLFNIDYDSSKEPDLNFKNSWVQQRQNQKAILDTFIKPIKVKESLIFIYAKNIPNVDSTARVLIGVGRVTKKGEITEYDYDNSEPPFRSVLWERPVYHSIREDFKDGFLLPYQEFFKFAEADNTINLLDYVAFAPTFEEFSYGSEWVSNDSAIESLLVLADKLRRFQELLPDKDYSEQLKWIDNEISRIWKLRGAFPGLGAVLAGLKVEQGNFIAWELDSIIRDQDTGEATQDPWNYVERLMQGDTAFIPAHLNIKISDTVKDTWKVYSKDEKDFFKLLSRMNVDNLQVEKVINKKEKELVIYLSNPYKLYEDFRHDLENFSLSIIDKAIFATPKILSNFPLSAKTDIDTALDKRRLRAVCINLLEDVALMEGHTLLTDTKLVSRINELPLQPVCSPSIKNLIAIDEFLSSEVQKFVLDEDEEIYYFKLKRLEAIKQVIRKYITKRVKREIKHEPVDWLKAMKEEFGSDVDTTKPGWYQEKDTRARQEKANALDILMKHRLSVLIGPAGTGKTTLLNLLCKHDSIKNGSILKLAPTGKARVNLGKDAKTLAQFLIKAKRYNPQNGQYYVNPNAEAQKYDTVIVDEASMLTEEQLAALIDSLTGVTRFILVGDYRQLPPIGAGRPFVDIITYLKEKKKGVAELKTIFRQLNKDNLPDEEPLRLDVNLSQWFSDSEIKKEEIDIFKEIANKKDKDLGSVRLVEWDNVRHLEDILYDVIDEEVKLILEQDPSKKDWKDPIVNFATSLGGDYQEKFKGWISYNDAKKAAKEAENWQILSPTRNSGYGTKLLNQLIQKRYKGKTKDKATFPGTFTKKSGEIVYIGRKMPKPAGDDNIVYGDKVINTKNTRWSMPWQEIYNHSKVDEEEILKYVANGEIGIQTGVYRKKWTGERPVQVTFSSQPDYAYSFKSSDFGENGEIELELAYSITVHKSQGSGFKTVFFVLPNPCPILTRELLYTALTRQKERIVILHQGSFKDFSKFTSGEYSETARRFTDIFAEPSLKLVNHKFYDTKYIQVSAKGEFMISKSEVIIADQLHAKNIRYAYEAPLADDSGITIHPDFTIEDDDTGITYYWEHLGMLTKDDYRSKWKRKQEWYDKNGIKPYDEDNEDDKQLIITRDKPDGGIDASEIREIIEELVE